MTTETAARTAGRTVATIRTWCRYGAVKAVKVAGRWVIDAASLARRIALTAKEQPMQPALTKTLADGRTATVTRDGKTWTVAINGQPYTSGDLHKRPDPRTKGATIWAIGSTKVIGLTDAEYATLKAVLDAEHAAWLATPRGQHADLLATAELAASALTTARQNAANTGNGWDEITRLQCDYDAALVALDAFNAAHPNLVAERNAERTKATEQAIARALTD